MKYATFRYDTIEVETGLNLKENLVECYYLTRGGQVLCFRN